MIKLESLAVTCFSAIALLVMSCSKENVGADDNGDNSFDAESEGYYISLVAELSENKSRAHWDIADDENNTLTYAWDATEDEMKSFVARGGELMDFIDGKKHSSTAVMPDSDINTKASLEIIEGLSEPYRNDDVIWAASPITEENIKTTENAVSVEFVLPDEYIQNSIATTEHLKPYVFMTGTGTVANNSASLNFKALTAIYRFKITNNDAEALTVEEVGITGPFCNKVVVGVTEEPQYSVLSGAYTIKVSAGDSGINIENGKTAYLYALVFPTATSAITDNINLYIKGKYGDVSADYSITAPCNAVYNFNLESNKYYDMQVPVLRTGIDFGGVEIEEFQSGDEFDIII